MKIKGFYISKLQLVIAGLILIGLAIGVYLVQRQQVLKSRASETFFNAFDVQPQNTAKFVNCAGGTCQTNTLKIQIRLKDIDALNP